MSCSRTSDFSRTCELCRGSIMWRSGSLSLNQQAAELEEAVWVFCYLKCKNPRLVSSCYSEVGHELGVGTPPLGRRVKYLGSCQKWNIAKFDLMSFCLNVAHFFFIQIKRSNVFGSSACITFSWYFDFFFSKFSSVLIFFLHTCLFSCYRMHHKWNQSLP